MNLALVQVKPRKGNREANFAELRGIFEQLQADGAPDLIVLPEAAMTGYFLEGAVYELAYETSVFVERLAAEWRAAGGKGEVDIVSGFFENDRGTYYNSAVYATISSTDARIAHVHRKMFLPTYGVFDEERFLSRGRRLSAFQTRFGCAAILICEDAWHAIMPTIAAIKGARLLIIPSASPGRGLAGDTELESVSYWRELLRSHAMEHGIFVLYAGLTGFEGGKGMTGSTCIIGPTGGVIAQAPALGACIIRATLDLTDIDVARASLPLLGDLAAVLPDLLLDDELPLPRGHGRE
jgi:N-carbamoylputrescine amidase